MVPYNHKHDFLPSRDSDLLNWSRNFSTHINADAESYGLTPVQAGAYAALHSDFAAAYKLATDPGTNSKTSIVAKNMAKTTLKARARMLARLVRATPEVTNAQRVTLGLNVPDEHLTPVTPSHDAPVLIVNGTMGRAVRLKLRGSASAPKRARPDGMIGALILSYATGPNSDETNPPLSISKWSYCCHATRSTFQMSFPSDVPAGSKVWLAACWVNTRGKSGPMSVPVSTRVGEGVGNFAGALRLAA